MDDQNEDRKSVEDNQESKNDQSQPKQVPDIPKPKKKLKKVT